MSTVHVIFQNQDFLVLDKPSGMPTTSPSQKNCLVECAKEIDPKAPRLHPTSRLDSEVTGIVVFARNSYAISAILKARAAGLYQRRYIALAYGYLPDKKLVWSDSIGIDVNNPRKRVVSDKGQASCTYVDSIAQVQGCSFIVLWPKTGRTHQLRVHSSHSGYPLLGDIHYGGPRRITKSDGRIVTCQRVLLHCAEVILFGIDKEPYIFKSQLPDDFKKTWSALEGAPSMLEEAYSIEKSF